jgi:hypothetical protein
VWRVVAWVVVVELYRLLSVVGGCAAVRIENLKCGVAHVDCVACL